MSNHPRGWAAGLTVNKNLVNLGVGIEPITRTVRLKDKNIKKYHNKLSFGEAPYLQKKGSHICFFLFFVIVVLDYTHQEKIIKNPFINWLGALKISSL